MVLAPPPTVMQNSTQPKAIEKATGQVFMVVRDDVAANGKLYIAPLGMLTSMRSIKPEVFKENFEWYVPPADRPLPVVREIPANNTQQQPLTPEGAVASWPEGPILGAADGMPELAAGADEAVKAMVTEPKKRGRPKGSKNKRKKRKT
jgi:hypothetical protein